MDVSFASLFIQQFSSFCLKNNLRVMRAVPDFDIADNAGQQRPICDFLMEKHLLGLCEEWIKAQNYSVIFRHEAADDTSFWLHDVKQGYIIHIRFIHKLALAGVTFCELNAMIQRATFQSLFYQPDPVDQAIILLMYYGFKHRNVRITARYAPLLKTTFLKYQTALAEKFIAFFGSDVSMDLEKDMQRSGSTNIIAHMSYGRFFYHSWTRIGGDVYYALARHIRDVCKSIYRCKHVTVTLYGGDTQRQTDIINYIGTEFRSMSCYFSIVRNGEQRWFHQLVPTIHIPVYLDKKTLDAPMKHGLFLPNEIHTERAQMLLRMHIIARLEHYFLEHGL